MSSLCDVVVVGSSMIDFVVYVDELPLPGMTIFGTKFNRNYGGKGANQAVQVARLNGKVSFVSMVGNDSLGQEYRNQLQSVEGVNTDFLCTSTTDNMSGTAHIVVAKNGSNQIVVVPGANYDLQEENIHEDALKQSKVIVCQNEIPLKCTIKALKTARKHSIISIFNCAPALPLAQLEEAIDSCDILCPNETELSTLTGTSTSSNEDIVNASLMVLNKCPNFKLVVVTLGENGCCVVSRTRHVFCPTEKTNCVDTVGAGDSFIGTLAFILSKNYSILEAITCALKIASLSVTRFGAQKSYSYATDIPTEFQASKAAREDLLTL